jgi:hypothetical protein
VPLALVEVGQRRRVADTLQGGHREHQFEDLAGGAASAGLALDSCFACSEGRRRAGRAAHL